MNQTPQAHSSKTASRESSAPAGNGPFDVVADIVVVGGGGAGLPTALFSRWHGNDVVVLEKAPHLGGTAKKAAFWFWVPNNAAMQSLGIEDTEQDFLHYVARLSRPQTYNPADATLGKSQWEYDSYRAFYESASTAAEELNARDALVYRPVSDLLDYWAHLPEDKAPKGRVLVPRDARDSMSDGGEVAIRTLSAAAERDGVAIRLSHRVQRMVMDGPRVVGVEATTPDGVTHRFGARKAVIFATGGFTHNRELRENFLSVPVFGGCAAVTNEGDFISMAGRAGAELRNMNYAWMCPIPLEKAVGGDPSMSGMFSVAGDSTIFVDKHGRRVVNEKLSYNELAQVFFRWDSKAAEYPNLVLFQIWDQRSQEHSASDEYGRLITPEGASAEHVVQGRSLPELAANLERRLSRYAGVTGGLALDDDFAAHLRETIERWNGFAAKGVDDDFHRGENPVELVFNGPVKQEADRLNPMMWPISDEGPYYAALVVGGTLDTKGGPKTNTHGQVLDDSGTPVPGLYGVGNCVASASAQAYWAGGATLGPIMAFAHRSAASAHAEQPKELAKNPVGNSQGS